MVARSDDQEHAQPVSPIEWMRLLTVYLLIPLILLICGGDLGWWQAWVFSLLFFVAEIGGRPWTERSHNGDQAPGGAPRRSGAIAFTLPDVLVQPQSAFQLGLAVFIVLAAIFHITRGEIVADVIVNIVLLALCLFVAYGRMNLAPIEPR